MSKKLRIILTVVFVFLTLVIIGLIRFLSPVNNDIYANIDDVNLEEEYPEAWAELGESLKYLELGEEDFYCGDNATYVFSDKFKEVFHKMHGGYYKNTSDEQIHVILLDKIDRMTTFELNAGEVYKKLKPIDGATIEAYLEIIDKRIAENKTREEAELAESKTASAQLGYQIGSKYTFSDGKEYIYRGNDKFTDTDGNVWVASKTGDNEISIEKEIQQVADATPNKNNNSSNKNNSNSNNNNSSSNKKGDPNSPYLSERLGYSVGDTMYHNGENWIYFGENIWSYSQDGYRHRLVEEEDGSLGFRYVNYTYAEKGETPVSERVGYSVGDQIEFTREIVWEGDTRAPEFIRTYLGNDIWQDSDTGKRYRAFLNESGELDWGEI